MAGRTCHETSHKEGALAVRPSPKEKRPVLLHRPLPLLGSIRGSVSDPRTRPKKDAQGFHPGHCPSWARTRTLLIQSQACCQLHQGAVLVHGAEGDRTPDLCSAIAALSQLSYSPTKDRKATARPPSGQPKHQALLGLPSTLAPGSGLSKDSSLPLSVAGAPDAAPIPHSRSR
jgi:hypothetical protein